MAAYRRVYDKRHLQTDCQEPGICSGTLRWVIEYGLPLPIYLVTVNCRQSRLAQCAHLNVQYRMRRIVSYTIPRINERPYSLEQAAVNQSNL